MELRGKKIAVSGSSGLVGSAVSERLADVGAEVAAIVRQRDRATEDNIHWNHRDYELQTDKLSGLNAVVHLAGENIAGLRWTGEKMKKIERSRVDGTHLLADGLAGCGSPPEVFVCASAVGYYGDRGDDVVDEDTPSGDNFLARVCREWEDACRPLAEAGTRVVNLRMAMVLSPDGGALPVMLPAFKLGLAGRLGDGGQWMSWVALEDAVRAVVFALTADDLSGPVNVAAPEPVTNERFTRTLAGVLRRPAVLPAPAPLLRLALGRMADEMLLASCRAVPARLQRHGFEFECPDLADTLRRMVG